MDKREALKSMLNNLINDKSAEASLDLHTYLTAKMKDVAGFTAPAPSGGDDSGYGVDDSDGADD